jgi:2-keto-3-deoxy-L-rhamnonate aldolase RhmA
VSGDTPTVPESSKRSTWGADGVLLPYINTAEEAREAISCAHYPTVGTRAVYFPQRSMNKAGLLGYAGNWNSEGIVALQVETASCINNIAEIAAHHVLTQAGAYVADMENIGKEKGKSWKRRSTALF